MELTLPLLKSAREEVQMEIVTATPNTDLFFYYTQGSKFKTNERVPQISKTTL